MDSRGNIRATDIGITWQGGDTFLHGVRVVGPEEDIEDTQPRPATSTPKPAGTRTPLMWNVNTTASTSGVHGNSRDTNTPNRPGRTSRLPADSTDTAFQQQIHRLAGVVPSFQGRRWPYTDGTRTNEHYNSSRTSTRRRWTSHRSSPTGSSMITTSSSSC